MKILTTVIPLLNRGAMAMSSDTGPHWPSAPHSQIMVSQAVWPKGEYPWQVKPSQAGLSLTSQEGLFIDVCTRWRPTNK